MAEPAKLSPVRKPRLHSPRALLFGKYRGFKCLIESLAQRLVPLQCAQQLILLAIGALVVNSVLVTMDAQKYVVPLQRSWQAAASRTLRTRDRIAGHRLGSLPAMYIDHEVVNGVQEVQQTEMRLQRELRFAIELTQIRERQG